MSASHRVSKSVVFYELPDELVQIILAAMDLHTRCGFAQCDSRCESLITELNGGCKFGGMPTSFANLGAVCNFFDIPRTMMYDFAIYSDENRVCVKPPLRYTYDTDGVVKYLMHPTRVGSILALHACKVRGDKKAEKAADVERRTTASLAKRYKQFERRLQVAPIRVGAPPHAHISTMDQLKSAMPLEYYMHFSRTVVPKMSFIRFFGLTLQLARIQPDTWRPGSFFLRGYE